MARTSLTVQKIAVTGLTPTYAAGDQANGHSFLNDGNCFLQVKNTNAATRDVTIQTPAKMGGMDVSELIVTIPANTGDKMIGPFDPTTFNQAGGLVNVDLSADTGITLGVFKLG